SRDAGGQRVAAVDRNSGLCEHRFCATSLRRLLAHHPSRQRHHPPHVVARDQRASGEAGLTTITIETLINAPPEVCFDLALDVSVHVESAAFSAERVVEPGRTSGALHLGDLL